MTERFAHGVAIGTKVRPRPSPERIVADKTHARRSKLVRTVKTAAAFQLELAFMNAGCGTERPRAARKTAVKASYGRRLLPVIGDSVGGVVIRSEPPGTDPYAGWCGGRELITPGYPIGLFPADCRWNH